jgi:uncharacterized lipoprotein YehR (DUF1307 family)
LENDIMHTRKILLSTIAAGLMIAGLAACQKKDESATGPAETAGRQIDQAAATTNEKLEKVGEKINAGAIDLTKKAGEKMEQAGEKIQNAADKADK